MAEKAAESPEGSEEKSDSPGSVNEGLLRDLVETQREIAEVQREENKVRLREIEANSQYAEKALEAQERDRQRYFEYLSDKSQRDSWIGFGVIVLIFAFLGGTILTDNQEFALELVRIIIYAGGGYAAGRYVQARKEQEGE